MVQIITSKNGSIIRPAGEYLNDVILCSAERLIFSFCSEILHGVYPELNDETMRYPQGDKAKVQDDYSNYRIWST